MKKTLLALMATASIFLASCGSKSDSAQAAVADEALTVDNVLDNAEVNRYALRKLRKQLEAAGVKRGFSNSRTCEIGLTVNGGVPYQSIAYLVDECTIKK